MSTSANPYAAPSMEVPRPVEQRRALTTQGKCAVFLVTIYTVPVIQLFEILVGLDMETPSWFLWRLPADLMLAAGRVLSLLTMFSVVVAMNCGLSGKSIRLPMFWYVGGMTLYMAWMDAALTMGIASAHSWLAVRFSAVVVATLIVLVVVHRLARVDYLASQAGNASPDSKPNGPSPIEDTNQFQ